MTPVEMWLLSFGGAVGYAATMLGLGCCLVPAMGLAALVWAVNHWPKKQGGAS